MNILPLEINDHVLYFTVNKVFDLSQVCKYFNYNVKQIRINSNKNYPGIKDEHLAQLPNITSLIVYNTVIPSISNKGVTNLHNLTELNLHNECQVTILPITLTSLCLYSNNKKITNENISTLTNLISLNLEYNYSITDDGISILINLKSLRILDNICITNNAISKLTNLTSLILIHNHEITVEDVEHLHNLTYFELEAVYDPLFSINTFPYLPKIPGLIVNNKMIRY